MSEVLAREQEQSEHDRGEERRVLRGEGVAHRQAGQCEQQHARRSVALAQHQPEGGEAQERREHVREQQLREREHHRAEAERHRGGDAVTRLVAFCHAPHQQHEQQPRQHVAPQADQIDHLVPRVVRWRHVRVGPRFRADDVERVVERQREQRQAGCAGGVRVALVFDLVAGVRGVGVDRRAVVVKRADQVVVRGLIPGEALDHRRVGDPDEQDRDQREALTG